MDMAGDPGTLAAHCAMVCPGTRQATRPDPTGAIVALRFAWQRYRLGLGDWRYSWDTWNAVAREVR